MILYQEKHLNKIDLVILGEVSSEYRNCPAISIIFKKTKISNKRSRY
jgi:hypothetical protein